MMIRVYELTKNEVIVVTKPKILINKVSGLLKFMIMRDKQYYCNPIVAYTKLEEIATEGEYMKPNMLIKILIHLSIIAPKLKSRIEAIEEFVVPSMFPDSIPTEEESAMTVVPSIFCDSSLRAVRARNEPNQLLCSALSYKTNSGPLKITVVTNQKHPLFS